MRDLTKSERAQAKVSAGVFIDSVEPGPAFDSGLRKGDIILQINSQPIETPTALTEIVDALKPNTNVPVLIHRQGGPLFLAMKIPSDG
ncbi:MAG: PDZ domain-containing protein [Gammaproteobacteria bacterium]